MSRVVPEPSPLAEADIAYVGDAEAIAQTFFELIQMARDSIVLQMYLFAGNGHTITLQPREGAFPYAQMVADWLIEKRQREPHVTIVVLLDTNTPDDSRLTRFHEELVRHKLERGGIAVLNVNLFSTRFRRERRFPPSAAFHAHWQKYGIEGWVERKQRWQVWHNVEDHRKNMIIDQGAWTAITSHNFIDVAAYWHENLLLFDGQPARDAWLAARDAIRMALELPQRIDESQKQHLCRFLEREHGAPIPFQTLPKANALTSYRHANPPLPRATFHKSNAALLTNEQIAPKVAAAIDDARAGDQIALATTYFSDMTMWKRLQRAAERGATVRILIDDIAGLPLDPFLGFLVRHLVNRRFIEFARNTRHDRLLVRIHDSSGGELMHLKTIARKGAAPLLIAGQANYTPNSFNGAWWETDIEVHHAAVVDDFLNHFENLWNLPQSRELELPSLPQKVFSYACRAALAFFALIGLEP